MLSKNNLVEEKLKNIVLLQQAQENERNYDWTKDYEDINFWNFLSKNYLDLNHFFTLLDIETGPNSGWEKFVEVLGLSKWEDRKWCYQYHNGVGPTKTALSKLLGKENYDENLSLGSVLEFLKEMKRYDILLQIDWQHLIGKLKKEESTTENKEIDQQLIFQLNNNVEVSQSVNLECLNYPNDASSTNDLFIKYGSKNKKQSKPPSTFCILMSYASDTEEYALKIATQLRRDGIKRKKFKIVMLGDPTIKTVLATDCSNTLHKWFNQVRYVVPILSPQYLKQVQNLGVTEEDREVALHNRLIYKLVFDQYVSFGSINLRCRPVCPDIFYPQVKNNSVVKGNGLFSIVWNCSNENQIEDLRMVLMDKPLLH